MPSPASPAAGPGRRNDAVKRTSAAKRELIDIGRNKRFIRPDEMGRFSPASGAGAVAQPQGASISISSWFAGAHAPAPLIAVEPFGLSTAKAPNDFS